MLEYKMIIAGCGIHYAFVFLRIASELAIFELSLKRFSRLNKLPRYLIFQKELCKDKSWINYFPGPRINYFDIAWLA